MRGASVSIGPAVTFWPSSTVGGEFQDALVDAVGLIAIRPISTWRIAVSRLATPFPCADVRYSPASVLALARAKPEFGARPSLAPNLI